MRFGGKVQLKNILHEIALMVMKDDFSTLKRSPNMNFRYDKHAMRVAKEYGSVDNFIREKYLNNNEDYNLTENNFPYNIKAKHLILWSRLPLTNEEIEIILNKELKGKDYFWFEQTYERKSVKSVNHVHVFTDLTN